MKYLFEFLLDLTLGDGGEGRKTQPAPKPVRWIVLGLMALCFVAAFGFILVCGVLFLKTSVAAGLILIFVGLSLGTFLILLAYYHIHPAQPDAKEGPTAPSEETKEHTSL